MGKIVVFENITFDGVIQDPTGEEGLNREDWRAGLSPSGRETWARLIVEDALGAQALLLGRGGYEYFATRYPSRTGALADQINGLPKYVVSTTLTDPGWNNSTVLKGPVVDEVSALKEAIDGEIRVYASSRLVHTLIEHDLVDEVRLLVFPVLMGAGARLFERDDKPKPLRPKHFQLVDSRRADDLTLLTFRRD